MINYNKLLKFEDKIIEFLLYLFPLVLVFSVFLSNLIIGIFCIFFICNILFLNDLKFYLKNKLVIFLFILCSYFILCSLLSENVLFSLHSSLFYVRFLIFSIVVAYILNKNNRILYYLSLIIWLVLIGVILDGYLQYFTGKNILGWEQLDPVRVSGFFREELILGSYLSRIFPLALFFIFLNYKTNNSFASFQYLSLIVLVLIDVLIYLAGERIAVAYMLLTTVSIIVLIKKLRLLRILSLAVSIIVIILINILQPEIKGRMVDFTLSQLSEDEINVVTEDGSTKKNKIKTLNAFSTKHESHYISAIEMFKDKPFFGHGPRTFRIECLKEKYYPEGCSTHPHNTYIQLLSETGIIGFLGIFGLFIFLSINLLKQIINVYILKKSPPFNDQTICLFIAFLITLWPLAPTGSFFGSWLNSIYYLPLGFYLYSLRN